jgi:two-component system NtrC family sensor kinase
LLTNVVDTLLARLGIDAGWVLLPGKMPDAPAHLTAARGISDGFAAAEQVHHLGACARCAALLARQEPANKPSKITECPILPADILEASGLHSYISLPMEVGQRVLGIMHLGWREAHAYTREEHSLLLNIGRQTALALRNAQLYQTALQVDRLQTINAIGVAASSSLELETVLRQVLQMACQALDASEGSILLHEPETGELVFTLSIGRSTTLQGQRIPAGKGLAGWVVEHAQVARVNNVRLDERWYPYPDEVSGFETHSLLCAPLIYHERVTGVIEIVNKRRSEFSEEDAGLIEAVSSIAAVALENARLYTTTRTRAEELKLLYEIGIALTRSLDYNMVVDDALARVQRLFQAKYVSLLQPDPQTGELIFIKALAGAEPVTIPLRLKSGEGLAGWVYEHREVILTNDAQTDPRFSGRADRLTGLQTRSLMAVPLLTGGSVTGIIEVISERPAAYSADDLRTLQSLTSTLAVALDNARLYEDLKRLLIERERAHAQLIQSEKISALGRLAASVAHEINNPLQAVQGCLTLFGEEMAGQQRQDKMGRYLHTVESEIERIAAIVRRMRDFYRPAREGLSSVNVVEVLESVLELAAKQLQHSEVEVRRDWEIEIPAIQANPDHLKQVFLNLIINAIDAMPQGGELRLSVSATHQPPENSPLARPHVRIEFSDTGHGMSPETTDQVFEPFFTTKDQGSGLGLYISYGIIKSLAGDITVHSQLGQGTTFTIFLPIKLD